MTKICEVTKEYTLTTWLCDPCIADRTESKQMVKVIGETEFGCDDCDRKKQVSTLGPAPRKGP